MGLMGVLIGIGVLGVIAAVLLMTRYLHIASPNEVLIFSGRRHKRQRASVGYRSIQGGRGIKWPMVEVVDRVDLTNMVINVGVNGAFSLGGIPLNVDGVANVKVAGQEPLLGNAVERFLGKTRKEIMQVAKETLEGNLRGVLAKMTPEEVNHDKIRFATELIKEADIDLHRLGLELDTLKIQNVSDERGYLDSIGRISSAEIRKQARIAEADNQSESMVQEASNKEQAQLVAIEAAIRTMKAEAERRVADAQTKKHALVAESVGEVQAAIIDAKTALEVQRARIEQVREQLEADVMAPANAAMEASINKARGDAAKIVEDGRATASVLTQITAAWRQAGDHARDVFLMQKLQSLVETLTETVEGVKVDRVTVLGAGAGGGNDLARKVIGASEQLKAALGVDLVGALEGKLSASAAAQIPSTGSASNAPIQPVDTSEFATPPTPPSVG